MHNGETTGSDRTVICDIASLRNESEVTTYRDIKLVIVEGANQGQQVDIKEGRTHIGREPENELVLALASVSRKHAEISRSGDLCTVSDLDAANGVFINGKKLPPRQPSRLHHGDSLVLGRARLLFLDPGSEASSDRRRPSSTGADDWIKRIYAIDPLAEKD